MNFTKQIAHARILDCLRPALIIGLALCLANYSMDILMDRMGINGAKTILNDLAIGILGAVGVFFYLSASRAKSEYASAKERISLIRELNRRIRRAVGLFATSAISDDPCARLQGIDEATERIDRILADFTVERKKDSLQQPAWSELDGTPESPDSPADL
jgi:hypothetical protein